MAQAYREVVNPSDPSQRYVMYDNGRIDSVGGALPITGTPTFFNTVVAPTLPAGPMRALQIIDWTTPSGYVMDWNGTVTQFGNATAPGSQAAGVPSAFPIFIDFFMNPVGNGQGYLLDEGGAVHEMGGASAVGQPAATNINTGQFYRRLIMETFGGRYYAMTSWGLIYDVGGAAIITLVDGAGISPLGPRNAFWPNWDIARAIKVYDFVHGYGWMLDGWGGIHALNGAETVVGQHQVNVNYWPNWDIARDLNIIDNGTGSGPLTTLTLDGLGPDHQIVSSTAPTVAVTAPTGTITNTTRPVIQWNYSDAEGDAQQSYDVKVFSHAQWSVGGFNPASSTPTYEVKQVSSTVFNHSPKFDFSNDSGNTWRAYVQVTDTSGLASSWQFSPFIMNTTPPPTPTLTPAAGATALDGISVLAHISSVPAGTLIGIQYNDSTVDAVWRWVRGRVSGVTTDASALVPNGSGNATIIDDEASFGVLRTYRALSYTVDGNGNIIASVFSIVATGRIQDQTEWVMSDPLDYTNALVVHIRPNTFKLAYPTIGSGYQFPGRREVVAMTDGTVHSAIGQLQLTVPDPTDYAMIYAMYTTGDVLLLRDPYGNRWYFQSFTDVGGQLRGGQAGGTGFEAELILAPPDCGEVAPSGAGYLNHVSMPLIEVERPLSGPLSGILSLTD